MHPLFALSRRALVAAGVLAAPIGAAAKKKRKTKKKPPPPLAFAAATVIDLTAAGNALTFVWAVKARAVHPATGNQVGFTSILPVDSTASSGEVAAALAAEIRRIAADQLSALGANVTADRVQTAFA